MHGVTPQITLEKIPLDVLCEIWEVFDHVTHLTCERVSDPQQVCSFSMNICEHVVHCLLESLEYHIVYIALKQQQTPLIFCLTAFLDSLHVSCTASFFYSSAYLSDDNVPHISLSLFIVGTKP